MSSRLIIPVDHWTLGGIAHSLEDRCLSCVGSSNDEDTEFEIAGESGEILLRIHSTKVCSLKTEDYCSSGGSNYMILRFVWAASSNPEHHVVQSWVQILVADRMRSFPSRRKRINPTCLRSM
jgi:hypothetical protein